MAQKYLDISGLERYHDGLIEYMAEAVGTQADMSVVDPTNMAYIHNVPEWVRSETKPEYNFEEVDADATGTAQTEVFNHNISETAHEDIRNSIQEINTQIETKEASWNDKYTKEEVDSKNAEVLTSAKNYTDTEVSLKYNAAQVYAETQASKALENAKTYTTEEVSSALSDAKVYADSVASTALDSAKTYSDTAISNLINGAPSTLDTLKEISDAMAENEEVVATLDEAIGTKANKTDLTSHVSDTVVHITSDERTNWNDANSKKHEHSNKTVLDNTTASFTTEEKTKLSGIATGANAYTHPSTHAASMITGLATVATSGKYSDLSGTPSALPASDVYSWAKASSKPSYTKAEVGLGNVDNTADSAKSVKYAATAGSAPANGGTATWAGYTSNGSPSDATLKNIYAGTSALTSGSSTLATGTIYIQYE